MAEPMTLDEALAHQRAIAGCRECNEAVEVVAAALADAREATGAAGMTLDEWDEWSNEVADLMPDAYDGDEAQEAIILRYVKESAAALADARRAQADAEARLADAETRIMRALTLVPPWDVRAALAPAPDHPKDTQGSPDTPGRTEAP